MTSLKFVLSLLGMLFASLLFPREAPCWSSPGHRRMTELALINADPRWELDRPIRVRPLSAFVRKLSAESVSAGHEPARTVPPHFSEKAAQAWFGRFLRLNPETDFARFPDGIGPGALTRPRDILIRHASDPDDGRDQNLNLRSYQKIFGGTTGPSSQAFRHMEKPRLSFSNWRSTLGLPFREAGEASRRAQVYFDLAALAKAYGEDYWSWRFLAWALHYVEDLSQPHHTTEISSRGRIFGRGLKILFGRASGLGFSEIVSRLVTNSHDWFETYAAELIGTEGELIAALASSNIADPTRTVRARAVRLRNRSNRVAPDLLESIFLITDERINGTYRYDQESWPKPDPKLFLNPVRDARFQKHEKRFFRLLRGCLKRGGIEIRTAVAKLASGRHLRSPRELLARIRQWR